MQEILRSVFSKEIPEKYRIDIPVMQKEYLINGKLYQWEGELQTVLSPVCQSRDGKPERTPIGSYPLLDEKEAIHALDAATDAFDDGRGYWPTIKV